MNSIKKKLVMLLMGLMLTFTAAAVISTAAPASVQAASTRTTLTKKVDAIIAKKTNSTDTKAVKLEKLFKYMRKNVIYQRDMKRLGQIPSKAGWTDTFALETINDMKGDCYHYAAMYASLANRATGYPTRVVIGKTCGFDSKRKILQNHAWVEIKIKKVWYVFDVNLDLYGKTTKNKTVPAMTYFMKSRTTTDSKKIFNSFKGTTNFTVSFK